MNPDPQTILQQHMKTTELLGVDFLPIGTPPDLPSPAPTQEPPTHNQTPEPTSPSNQPNFAPSPQPAPTHNTPQIAVASREDIRASYNQQPDAPSKLDALKERYIADAPHNAFTTSFTNIVFGEGNAEANLMFIGEAPGQQEDETGRPFVGKAGQLLSKMIEAMGFSRETVYITNVLKTRPPNNATPTQDEARLSAPYLFEQIRIINPSVIVTLGLPASHLILNTTQPMRSLRGQFHTLDQPDLPPIQVMPTYHPAYLLRAYTEDNRRKVWSDLTQVVNTLSS